MKVLLGSLLVGTAPVSSAAELIKAVVNKNNPVVINQATAEGAKPSWSGTTA